MAAHAQAQATASEAGRDVKATVCELPLDLAEGKTSQLELERGETSNGSDRERQRAEKTVRSGLPYFFAGSQGLGSGKPALDY